MQYSRDIVQTPPQTQPSAQDLSSNTDTGPFYSMKTSLFVYAYIFISNYKYNIFMLTDKMCMFSLTLGPFFTCSHLHLHIFYIVPEILSAQKSTAGWLLGEGNMQTDCSLCSWMITRIWWCFWIVYCERSLTDTLCSTLLTTWNVFGFLGFHSMCGTRTCLRSMSLM